MDINEERTPPADKESRLFSTIATEIETTQFLKT